VSEALKPERQNSRTASGRQTESRSGHVAHEYYIRHFFENQSNNKATDQDQQSFASTLREKVTHQVKLAVVAASVHSLDVLRFSPVQLIVEPIANQLKIGYAPRIQSCHQIVSGI